jgi:hypothetical protein
MIFSGKCRKDECKFRQNFFWLWLPVLVFAVLLVIEFTMSTTGTFYSYLVGENGPIEILQVLILMVAFILSVRGAFIYNFKKSRGLFVWLGMAALGCFYIIGEEISWGQHIFNWETSDSWAQINDQQETNLHNTSSWLDQKPRLLLEIGVIVGGIILPVLMRLREKLIPAWLKVIAPPKQMMVCAIIFLLIKVFDKIGDFSEFVFFKRASELTEMYVYYFIALYLFYLLKRMRLEGQQ